MPDTDDLQDAYEAQTAAAAAPQRQAIPTTVVNKPPAPTRSLDTWAPAEGAQPFTVTPDAPDKPAEGSSLWGTVGASAWQATKEMGSDALAAASFAARKATNDPAIVGYIEDARHKLDANIQSTWESQPADRQLAMHASIFGGGNDANGQHIPTPGEVGYKQYLAATLGSLIPDIALAVLPEAAASRLAVKLGVEGAAKVAGMTATGAAFGTDQAGGAYKALVDTVDHTSDTEMMGNPTYAHLRQDQGLTENQAKSKLVGSSQVTALIAAQFGVGAVTGAGTGQLITHGALGVAEKGLATRVGVGAAEGAATMGIQGGAGDYLQQQAEQVAASKQEYDPAQTAHAFVSGALGGALLGAAGGAFHSAATPEAPHLANPTTLPDDMHSALHQALQLDLPIDQAGPGPVRGSDQAELFRTAREANSGAPNVSQSAPAATSEATAPVNNPNSAGQGDMFPKPTNPVSVSTPEPNSDIHAQIAALADPQNPKDAVFIAKGTPMPGNLPADAKVVMRKEGALITNNPDKAKLFRAGPVTDEKMAKILDYPQTKADAVAGGNAQVVQGKDAQGNVVHESLATPEMLPGAAAAAQAHSPGGTVEVHTPEEVQARRQALTSDTLTSDHPVDKAAHQAVAPASDEQAEAGNYQKGHVKLHGLDISIENPKGSIRRGPVDPATGQPAWQTEMPAHYGYIKGTRGADGDHVDVALGGRAKAIFDGRPEDAAKEPVFVVDQIDPKTGKFDEHKALVGFHTRVEAERAYDASFSDGSGPSRRGATNEMEFGKFREWVEKGNTKQAISYKKPTVGDQLKAKRAAEKDVDPVHASREAEAEWVKQAIAGKADWTQKRKQALKDAQTSGMPMDQVMALISKGEEQHRAEHPEHYMTDDQIKAVGKHLESLDDVNATDVNKAAEAARTGAEPTARPTGRGKQMNADLEDKLAESGGKLDADEARQELRTARDATTGDREELASKDTTVVNEPSEESSAGLVTDYGDEKKRSEQTTNLNRILSDLEHKVTQGHLSATDAKEMYGAHVGKTAKEARTFKSWLEHQLTVRDDHEAERKAVLDAASKMQDKTLTAAQKKSLGNKLKAELAKYDPDYVNRLRDALDELNGHTTRSREMTPAIAYSRAVRDPALNTSVRNLLMSPEPKGLHAYLDAIMSDKDLQRSAGPMIALARRLKMIAPDIQVMTHEMAAEKYGPRYLRLQDAGSYHEAEGGNPALITMHQVSPMSKVETLLHEALHSVTSNYLDTLPKAHPDRLALNAIHDELRGQLDREDLSDRERGELEYALQDQHELHTMLMSNPTVQRLAANMTPSAAFTRRMTGLGYVGQAAKSVWSYFTAFVRRALGMSDRMDTMLDRILRPLQDITDRAAKFNDHTADVSPEAIVRSLPDFSKLKDTVADKVDPAGLPDKMRKLLLPGATTDGIIKWNKDLFENADSGNALKDYRTANEAIAHRTAAHHDAFADKVKDLLGQLKGKEHDKIASLLVDATTADAKIGRNLAVDANAHLKDLTEQRALQARFSQLSDQGKATYEAVRDYHKQVYAIERDAQLRSMVKTAIPDATPEQTKRIAEAARTKGGIETLIAGADTDPVAQAFGDAWNGRRAIVQGIAKVHRQGFVQGDYFPLRRYGDYVVKYGDKGEDGYGVEMFDSATKAQARRDELVKQGQAGVSPVMEKRSSKLRDALPTTVVDEMAAAMKQNPDLAEHTEAMRDLISSIQLQHATRSEQARTRMRRQGVKGASTEIEKTMAQDFLTTATRLGYLEHGVDRTNALSAMQRQVDYLGRTTEGDQQRRAQQVLNELQRRTPSGDDASSTLSNVARKFSTLGFVQSLMSPSHMITSSIEAHMNSTAILGARHGAIQAGVALARALKDITPTMAMAGVRNTVMAVGKGLKANDWNLSNVVRDKLIAGGANKGHMMGLFKGLNDAGLIDHSMVREMQRIANPGSDVTRGWWQRFMDLNAAGSHAVDVANKTAIAKAAFDLEFRKTADAGKATAYAIDTVRQTTPNYNLGNKARIATDKGVLGGFAGPLTQFKNYGIHMYSMMANLVKESIHGATKQERGEARKAFAGILATHAVMAGSLTLIGDPLRWIGGAYDFATGADKPHDYENDVRRWAESAFGPEMGEIITRGVPHAAGIDIHRRVGLANLLEPPELKSFDKKGFAEAVASAMTGAAGDDATTMAAGLGKMLHGDIMGGLQAIVPRVIRDPMKAYGLATSGVTDSKGKTILPASKISSGAVAAQAVGFQPSQVTEFREGRAAVQEAQQEASSERGKLMASMMQGGDHSEIIQRVRDFNQANPGQAITYSQLLQSQQRARKAAQQPVGSFGLKLPTKAAATLSKAGSFANVGS